MTQMIWSMLPLILFLFLCVGEGAAQDDFSGPIKCYTCEGTAENSTCSDPIDVNHSEIGTKDCDRGICLKWTKYRGGVLQMIRTCSSDLDFHLTMIDGVCRTERNGNGYLCMCGKHLCNSVAQQHGPMRHRATLIITLLLMCYTLLSQRPGFT